MMDGKFIGSDELVFKCCRVSQLMIIREPLCNFLDKPVPPKEFPNGNVPQDFLVQVAMNRERWRKEAKRNLFWTGTICTAAILGAVSATNPRALLILSQQWIKVLNIVGKFTSSS